ncbi:MAG TPA: AAA family ATPase [Solirubrobacterales bacterium]|nr:AAA family ATPase [Solirubrobacterales bacterium]
MLVGTVAYLPPEQALGRTVDTRADLYSLGAMLYELLTGEPPFPGEDAVAIIGQHLSSEPVPPSRHRPEVPPPLDELVLALLAKAPEDRPENAAVVRRALAHAADHLGEPAEPPAPENPLESLAGGIFVGREHELEEMRAVLEDALHGQGRLLLLTGDPGIGKTRTAEQLATYARVRGARVHWGRCHQGEGAPPYWPFTEAIRDYIAEADPVGLQCSSEAGRRSWRRSSPNWPSGSVTSRARRRSRRSRRAFASSTRLRASSRAPRSPARSCSCSTTSTGPTNRRCSCCGSSPASSPTPGCS